MITAPRDFSFRVQQKIGYLVFLKGLYVNFTQFGHKFYWAEYLKSFSILIVNKVKNDKNVKLTDIPFNKNH